MDIKVVVNRGWQFARYLFDGYFRDNCQTTAQALTYQTLFAVVPLLTVTFTIANAFKAFGDLTEKVQTFVFSNIIPENVSVVQEYIVSFTDHARNLGFVSMFFVALIAFLMLFTIEGTFNAIWRVKEPRHGFQRFLMYWAVLTLAVPFLGLSIAITGYIESLPFISDVQKSTKALRLLPLLLSGGLFTLIYSVVPNCSVSVKHAAIGGFAGSFYWSSTESDNASVYGQNFSGGNQYFDKKIFIKCFSWILF